MNALRLTSTLLVVLALAGLAVAHEGHHHDAMGTIEAIAQEQVSLRTSEEATQVFLVTTETSLTRGAETATWEDVEIGERAVVTYEKKGDDNVAIEIKLAAKAQDDD
jgi:hypothetical protein